MFNWLFGSNQHGNENGEEKAAKPSEDTTKKVGEFIFQVIASGKESTFDELLDELLRWPEPPGNNTVEKIDSALEVR